MIMTEAQRDSARVALYFFLKTKIGEYPMASTMIGEEAQRKLAEEGAKACCDAIEEV